MTKTERCLQKYGVPELERSMTLLRVPVMFRCKGVIPGRIYCNKDIKGNLIDALQNIYDRNLDHLVKSYDGCFNIRRSKGGADYSVHSWGLAIDINATTNGYGKDPQMDLELVKCFTDAGFEWGGYWRKPDGMHFECLTNI